LLLPASTSVADDLPVSGRSEPALAEFDRLMVSFVREHDVPGASLAIARHGRIVYARGFGYADVERHTPVEPDSLFRIASVSKPFTATAILQLQERGKLTLDDHPFEMLGLNPHLENGAMADPRLRQITIRELLHHTGGFDRNASFDPMFRPIQIARAMGVAPPAGPREIIQYVMGRPLDFDPGTKEAYSNFGYCVLGRVIEKASGTSYSEYVEREVLKPLGIRRMRPGHTLERDRAGREVHYYPRGDAHVKSALGDGGAVPIAYGGFCLEAMDSHGGWIASASELARFADSFDDPDHCPILNAKSIAEMFARPQDTGYDAGGKPKAAYYACGWEVRPTRSGRPNTWHAGLLAGTSTLLVRRYDGITWAVLFNSDSDPNHHHLADLIDPMLHPVADRIRQWPQGWELQEADSTR
ncbi:MAG TPA: serine hydrolase domain-containing protein, partial [Tepidisphaeraceae bacterium]|nr:serine hydrolase domain-containing protein [Tepidisphaeraceae bacterium]